MGLVEERGGDDERGRDDPRQHCPERPMADRLAPRPFPPAHSGANLEGVLALRRAALAQEVDRERQEREEDDRGRNEPRQAPPRGGEERRGHQRVDRLGNRPAQHGDRDRAAAVSREPACHCGEGDVAHHALPAHAEAEHGEEKRPRPRREAHEEGRDGVDDEHADGDAHQRHHIDEPAEEREKRRGAERRHREDRAPLAVRKVELGHDRAREEGDDVGLAERRSEGEENAGPEPPGVSAIEGERHESPLPETGARVGSGGLGDALDGSGAFG